MNGVRACAQGTLPRDAELKYLPSGKAVLELSVAVHDAGRAEDAPTEWLRVTAWGELAEQLHAGGQLTKGAEVYVEGRVRLRTWTGQDGQQRAGLDVSAWTVQPMGQIGRRKRRPEPVEADRPRTWARGA